VLGGVASNDNSAPPPLAMVLHTGRVTMREGRTQADDARRVTATC